MKLFGTTSLARRIERAERTLIEEGAAAAARRRGPGRVHVFPLAGGTAVFTELGSPFNKVAGLGFEGLPDSGAMDEVERTFAALGAPVQVELASLGDPGVAKFLTGRGYALVGFENVLGLSLPAARPRDGASSFITIERAGGEMTKVWRDTVIDGFLEPDTFDGPVSHETFDRSAIERVYEDVIATGAYEPYVARYDGAIAGGASLRMFEGVAQLCGAATLKAYRRRGIQSALLQHRLADSAERGCDLAIVTTQPGSKSQENVQRFGFELLYTRAILVWEKTGS
ncbi:MAG TPA: GNAT family N-acetyltransferase [Vicinamibacterales bacterium]|nr:GNAT family N-acetyltransferase [Vicinamibacterales bacterium]